MSKSQTQHSEPASVPYKYAILQETSGEECESWYYFIRHEGNEKALENLKSQLSKVRWYILEDLSTFDLEIETLVSEQTAKEMIKVNLNHYSFHRKFDGKLDQIDLKLKDSYKNEKKMTKVFDVLGYGKIDEFIDKEDVDPEYAERTDSSSESEEDEEDEEEESDSGSGSDSDESDSKSESDSRSQKKRGALPAACQRKR